MQTLPRGERIPPPVAPLVALGPEPESHIDYVVGRPDFSMQAANALRAQGVRVTLYSDVTDWILDGSGRVLATDDVGVLAMLWTSAPERLRSTKVMLFEPPGCDFKFEALLYGVRVVVPARDLGIP